jgi:hypothetical protein
MKNNKNIFDVIIKICSILFLVLGFLLALYIYFGPTLGLIDAESASWGIVIAAPLIIIGVICVATSFSGYTKVSGIVMVLYVLVITFDISIQRSLTAVKQQSMINFQSQQVSQLPPTPQIPNQPTK